MLGLGVNNRLKARPSLLDLIASRGVDEELPSVTVDGFSSSPPGPANLPPLPDSPTSTTSSWSYSISNSNPNSTIEHRVPSLPIPSIRIPASHTMAPAKDGNDGDERGAVFSVSGSVVVAENMIGCAMYELVRSTFCCLQ